MTVLFENQFRPTDGILHEYVRRVVCKDLITGCVAAFVVCCIAIAPAIFFHFWRLTLIIGGVGIILISSAAAAPFLVHYHTHRQKNGSRADTDMLTLVYFGDHIEVNENEVRCQYTYDQITRVRVFRNFSVLEIGKADAVILSNAGFIKGSRIEFWRFIRDIRPDLKIDVAV